jgi:hypothetical protein
VIDRLRRVIVPFVRLLKTGSKVFQVHAIPPDLNGIITGFGQFDNSDRQAATSQ